MQADERAALLTEREQSLLMYWYGIHVKDRREFKAEPRPYQEWYVNDGQRLLINYYRNDCEKLQAVVSAAEKIVNPVSDTRHFRDVSAVAYDELRAALQIWREGS